MSSNDSQIQETGGDEVENLIRAAEEIIEENRSRRNLRQSRRQLEINNFSNDASSLTPSSSVNTTSSSSSECIVIDSSTQGDDDIIYIPNENDTNNIETIDLCNTPQTVHPKISRRRLADNVIISITVGSDEFEFPRSRDRRISPNSASTSSSITRQIFPIAQSSPKSPAIVTNTIGSTDNLNETSNVLARCPVCLESAINRNPMSTICGHIFCYACISQSINLMKQCPVCKRRISHKNIHKIFF